MYKRQAEIDGVSGSTITSDAVMKAAKSCYAQAKGEAVVSSVQLPLSLIHIYRTALFCAKRTRLTGAKRWCASRRRATPPVPGVKMHSAIILPA